MKREPKRCSRTNHYRPCSKIAAAAKAWTEALEGRVLLSAALLPADSSSSFQGSQLTSTNLAAQPAAASMITDTPAQPDLLDASDSGASPSDNITNQNNGTIQTALQFQVQSTLAGATVTVYADGTAIGSATANGSTTTITT